ncbi:MAG TPA: VapC toxin family PIN domain ribonuclease [Actinobacteria bacterium]|nr:VapC toxin family PIN domain ribonuclease [Actinomycetota bacterium]
MTAFIDANVIIRHLTADPPAAGRRATDFLASVDELLLPDVIAAECVFVLESFYELRKDEVARVMRAVIAFESIHTIDPALLLRALEVYETDHLDFADAYLVACAESAGVREIVSFDRDFDRVTSVRRLEP